jgi:hypothetical protein
MSIKQREGKPDLSLIPYTFFQDLPDNILERDNQIDGPVDLLITLNRIMARKSNDLETLRNRVIALYLYVSPGTQTTDESFYHLVMDMTTVMEFGKDRYGRENWALGGSVLHILTACARHLTNWMNDPLDHETKKSHLVHALCNICFAMYYLANPTIREKYDDRTNIYNFDPVQ